MKYPKGFLLSRISRGKSVGIVGIVRSVGSVIIVMSVESVLRLLHFRLPFKAFHHLGHLDGFRPGAED